MIQIAILKTTPGDDIQSIAAIKLKEMIQINIEMLVGQLDGNHDVQNLARVRIIDEQDMAEESGMVFVLSDVLDQKKTELVFDQIHVKTKILIDLDPESKTDWKCGTYANSSVRSCFESRKNMSTKEMLLKVLYNHNKQNNHHETRALLLSALALGLECYDGNNKSDFCSKLMNENASQVVTNAYAYDMNKRSITVVNGLKMAGNYAIWAGTLLASTYLIFQTAIFGTVGVTSFIAAIVMAGSMRITIHKFLALLQWLKTEVGKGINYDIGGGNNVVSKLWNYLRSSQPIHPTKTKATSQPTPEVTQVIEDNNHISIVISANTANKIKVNMNKSGSTKTTDENTTASLSIENGKMAENSAGSAMGIIEKAVSFFGAAFGAIAWVVLSILFKIPAWINVLGEIGAKGILSVVGWTRLFKITDINIMNGKYNHNFDYKISQDLLEKYKWTLGIKTTLKYGVIVIICKIVSLLVSHLMIVPLYTISMPFNWYTDKIRNVASYIASKYSELENKALGS